MAQTGRQTRAQARVQDIVRYAGFWRRLLAVIIDSSLFTALSAPVLILIYGPAVFESPAADTLFGYLGVHGWIELLISYGLPVLLLIGFWQRWGATPGKLLLDCQVVELETGRPPGVRRALLRVVSYAVSALPLYLGFLWIAWDRHKQGFHDKIAGTVVLHRVIDDPATLSLAQWQREVRL